MPLAWLAGHLAEPVIASIALPTAGRDDVAGAIGTYGDHKRQAGRRVSCPGQAAGTAGGDIAGGGDRAAWGGSGRSAVFSGGGGFVCFGGDTRRRVFADG